MGTFGLGFAICVADDAEELGVYGSGGAVLDAGDRRHDRNLLPWSMRSCCARSPTRIRNNWCGCIRSFLRFRMAGCRDFGLRRRSFLICGGIRIRGLRWMRGQRVGANLGGKNAAGKGDGGFGDWGDAEHIGNGAHFRAIDFGDG